MTACLGYIHESRSWGLSSDVLWVDLFKSFELLSRETTFCLLLSFVSPLFKSAPFKVIRLTLTSPESSSASNSSSSASSCTSSGMPISAAVWTAGEFPDARTHSLCMDSILLIHAVTSFARNSGATTPSCSCMVRASLRRTSALDSIASSDIGMCTGTCFDLLAIAILASFLCCSWESSKSGTVPEKAPEFRSSRPSNKICSWILAAFSFGIKIPTRRQLSLH